MNSTTIKSFSVLGLFGTDDVHIPFDEPVKVLIGENGLGKTQILNLFYYTLTGNFFKLNSFKFDEIVLEFRNGEQIIITRDAINLLSNELYKNPIVEDVISKIGFSQFEQLKNRFLSVSTKDKYKFEEMYKEHFRQVYRVPMHLLVRAFEDTEKMKGNESLENNKKKVDNILFNTSTIYFPTFRRVEEDLHNLGYDDEFRFDQEDTLIQFGMDDVQKRFKKIEETIDKLLKEGLTQFTKDILNVVIDNPVPSTDILEKISEKDIDIILSRVGNLLPDVQKEAVKNIVANKQLKNPLSAYLLQKLIDIYEKQKELDLSVKVFRDVCNKYLINKEVFYDESAIKIYIKSQRTNTEINLANLSSGEKQIISIFSKVYLSASDKRFIVLFDEPELSLSMTWQKQLLPDILDSEKCDFMLAVTHSPFIFDNVLDKYAVGLSEYIKPSKIVSTV